jgi:hypothetical protein
VRLGALRAKKCVGANITADAFGQTLGSALAAQTTPEKQLQKEEDDRDAALANAFGIKPTSPNAPVSVLTSVLPDEADNIGAAKSSTKDENYIRRLIANETKRVSQLRVGPGTIISRDDLAYFNAAVRIKQDPNNRILGGESRSFYDGTEALAERIANGGYSSYNGNISADDAKKILRLNPTDENEIGAINKSLSQFYDASASNRDPSRVTPTKALDQFIDSFGSLNENQRAYVIAGVVNGAVKSPEYLEYYRQGGYDRDLPKGVEESFSPLDFLTPGGIRSAGSALLRSGLGLASRVAGADIFGSILAGGQALRARFSATAGFISRLRDPQLFEGGAAFIAGKGYFASIKPLTNLELYGTDVTRTAADIPAILQKVGFEAEDLARYRFVRLTEQEYADQVATRAATYRNAEGEFFARYGPNVFNSNSTISFAKDIASKNSRGETFIPIYINPVVFNSDEHIIQALSHEIFEIEGLASVAKSYSGSQYKLEIGVNVKNNLHNQAVDYGDELVLGFRKLIEGGKVK